MAGVRIEQVDITTLATEAIVNAANQRMLGGGGVDGAIHRSAGPGLLEECRRLPEVWPGVRCPAGQAIITAGHRLLARFVIHTVGPVWRGGGEGEPDLLAECYRAALALAQDNGLSSVAFPMISCGAYGFPLAPAARIAVDEVVGFLEQQDQVREVVLAVLGDEAEAELVRALAGRPGWG